MYFFAYLLLQESVIYMIMDHVS